MELKKSAEKTTIKKKYDKKKKKSQNPGRLSFSLDVFLLTILSVR